MTHVCDHCGQLIKGEALEITPVSDRGARPSVYWHKKASECSPILPSESASSPLARQLRRT